MEDSRQGLFEENYHTFGSADNKFNYSLKEDSL